VRVFVWKRRRRRERCDDDDENEREESRRSHSRVREKRANAEDFIPTAVRRRRRLRARDAFGRVGPGGRLGKVARRVGDEKVSMDRGDLARGGESVHESVGGSWETGGLEYWHRGWWDDASVAAAGGDEVGETVYAVESVGRGVGGRVAAGFRRG